MDEVHETRVFDTTHQKYSKMSIQEALEAQAKHYEEEIWVK